MRIVVFSDSHGNYSALHAVVLARPDADVFLHLGDGMKEFGTLKNRFPDKRMRGVAGNCDWGASADRFGEIACEGRRIFFTHGHLCGVKGGLDDFLHLAGCAGADIALYGHTHLPRTTYLDGLYVLNPGSVSVPRSGPASYGIIDITLAGVVINIVPIGGKRMP